MLMTAVITDFPASLNTPTATTSPQIQRASTMPPSAQTVSPQAQTHLNLRMYCQQSQLIRVLQHYPAFLSQPQLSHTNNLSMKPLTKAKDKASLQSPSLNPPPSPPPKERHCILRRPAPRTIPTPQRRPRRIRAHSSRKCHRDRYRSRGDGNGGTLL